MAGTCDIERCKNVGTHELDRADYSLCTKHHDEWKSTGLRLRANPKKHTLRLVEVMISDR